MSRMFASRNIQVGFSSTVVAASFRRSDRGTKLVIVHLLDTFLDIGRDRMDDVLQFLITILLCMSKPSPKVSFDVHLVIARGTCVGSRCARTQKRIGLGMWSRCTSRGRCCVVQRRVCHLGRAGKRSWED